MTYLPSLFKRIDNFYRQAMSFTKKAEQDYFEELTSKNQEKEGRTKGREQKITLLENQIYSSAEITVRIEKYIEDNLDAIKEMSDEQLYNLLCIL